MLKQRKEQPTKSSKSPEKNQSKKKEKSKVTNSETNIPPKPPLWKHVTRRLFIIGIAFIAAYITASRNNTESPCFAQFNENVTRRSFELACSDDYANETENWKSCIPKRCGRVVMDHLIPQSDVEKMIKIAKKGFAHGGSSGGASILDLHSGALSKDDVFINLYRLPQAKGLFTREDFNAYRRVRNAIHTRLSAEFGPVAEQLYLTHPTFFSKITSKPAKTIHDEYWHKHIDKETYNTFHYTSLLYLNTYNEDYKGGRFIFVDQNANLTVEPKKGRVSMFTSGSENVHYVEKVTSGERYAITISFTCNSSAAISDPDFGL